MIAATALSDDAGVVTGNGGDLAGIESLVPILVP